MTDYCAQLPQHEVKQVTSGDILKFTHLKVIPDLAATKRDNSRFSQKCD